MLNRWALAWTVAMRRLRGQARSAFALALLLGVALGLLALAVAGAARTLAFVPGFADPEQLWLVQLAGDSRFFDEASASTQLSHRAVLRLAEQRGPFERVGLALREAALLGEASGAAERVPALLVDTDWWSVLRPRLAAGRPPIAEAAELVLSAEFARQRFGSAEAALGRELRVDEEPQRVVGVLASSVLAPAPGVFPDGGEHRYALLRSDGAALVARLQRHADAVGEVLVVVRAEAPAERVQAELERWARAALIDLDPQLRARVYALPPLMLGAAPAQALALLAGAALIAAGAWLGAALYLNARMAVWRRPQHVLEALGVPRGSLSDFDRAYALALTLGVALVAALVVGAFVLASAFDASAARWLIGGSGAAPWLGLALLLGLVLLLLFALTRPKRSEPGRGMLSRYEGPAAARSALLRGLSAGQLLLALLVLTLLFAAAGPALQALGRLLAVDLSAVHELRIEFPADVDALAASARLEALRQAVERQGDVQRAAISTLPVLELDPFRFRVDQRSTSAYVGPRDWSGFEALPGGGDGTLILRSEQGMPMGGELLRYRVVTAQVEADFFALLGYRLRQGRIFADGAEGQTVLTPGARRVLFGSSTAILGLSPPGPPPVDEPGSWHAGLDIIGEVDGGPGSRRVRAAPGLGESFVAFLPYTGLRWEDPLEAQSAFIVFALEPGRALAGVLEAIAALLRDQGLHWEHRALAPALRASVAAELLGLSVLGLLAISLLLTVALSAAGTARLEIERRRSELATRLALGADEPTLLRGQMLRELRLPLALAALWLLLAAGLGAALPGQLPAGLLPAALCAALLVPAIQALAVWDGLAGLRERSLLETLRGD